MFSMVSSLFGKNSNSPSIAEGNTVADSVKVDDSSSINNNLQDSEENCNHETESGYNTESESGKVDQEAETQGLSFKSEYEIVNSDKYKGLLDPKQSPKTISYALKPLLYTTKYGAKALSATTVVGSYTLSGTSYVIAGMSYIPNGVSKMLEKIKEEDRDAVRYKVITASQNLLDLTSSAMYVASYVPYGAGMVLNEVSGIANQLDLSLSPEKIEQVCTKSDLFVEDLSSKLKEVTENSVKVISRFSNILLTRAEKQDSTVKRQEYVNFHIKELIRQIVNTRNKFSKLTIDDELKEQINSKLEEQNKTLGDLNEKYKKEFGNYSTELTKFLSSKLSGSEKSLESDVSKPDAPSTELSILSNISRAFSTPFSYLASGG